MTNMIEVAQMQYRNRELDQLAFLPTKRDIRVGRNIFHIVEDSREWVPASWVDAEGRLIGGRIKW
jgi:hypothetical protein